MPTISVILPAYNVSKYLPKCLDSLLAQSFTDWQAIVVDDGSSDDSLPTAQRYAECDSRIKVLVQKHAGQSAARNFGLQHATGEFVAFVDADDFVDADYFATLLAALTPDCDYVQAGYRRVLPDGSVVAQKKPQHLYQFISPCMRLYRRDWLQQHTLAFREGIIYEDVLFSVQLWASGAHGKRIAYIGYNYLANPHSTTAQRNRHSETTIFAALSSELHKASSFRIKMIILYTIFRLKGHFLFAR